MQEPSAVSHEEHNLPPIAMESTEKSSTAQELPPSHVQGSQPIYPTSYPSVPPDHLTHPPTSSSSVPPDHLTHPPTSYPSVPPDHLAHPPYPTATMPGGQPPVMYPTPYPTTHVVMSQQPGTYPTYYSGVPANMTQHQPVYTTSMAPQPQYPPTNLPPYPITTAPGPQTQFNSQPAYPAPTVFGPQQQYPVYQTTNTSMVTTQHPAVASSRPKDYLCWSILSMLFCVCPLGLVAVVFSNKTSDAVARQDWMAARRNSSRALIFNFLSLVLGIICYIVIIVVRLG